MKEGRDEHEALLGRPASQLLALFELLALGLARLLAAGALTNGETLEVIRRRR